jgi:hypothetical protein
MMKHTARIIIAAFVIAVAAIPFASGVCDAKKISDYNQVMGMEFAHIQGPITAISPAGDYLMLHHVKLYLVEAASGGRILATAIYGKNGDEIDLGDLRVGDWLYVYAGAVGSSGSADGNMELAAKEINVVSGKMSKADRKSFNRKKPSRSWKKELHKD